MKKIIVTSVITICALACYAQLGKYALRFDGSNDYVTLGEWFNLQTFTIELWVKPGESQNAYTDIFDNNHSDTKSFVLQQNDKKTNFYVFGVCDGSQSPTQFYLSPDLWSHIAITRDKTTKVTKVFVNGELIETKNGTKDVQYDGSQSLILASHKNKNYNRYWNGDLDEFRVWDIVRSEKEIQENMHKELSGMPNLVAYYQMSTGEGTILSDNSGHNRMGTLVNGTAWVSYEGYALKFDGVNDKVDLGNWFNYQTFTIEMLVKPSFTQNKYADIIDNNHSDYRSFVIQQNESKTNEYVWGSCDGAKSNGCFNLKADDWSHIAITRDGTNYISKVYINGGLIETRTGSGNIAYDFSENFMLAAHNNINYFRYWGGEMDELRIWNIVRTAGEIYDNADKIIKTHTNLVAYYKMTDGSGTVLSDNSGNRHNGTLIGGVQWVPSARFYRLDSPEISLRSDINALYSNHQIKIEGTFGNKARATLFDVQGRIVKVSQIGGMGQKVIPVHSIQNGIYLLSIDDKGCRKSIRLVIH